MEEKPCMHADHGARISCLFRQQRAFKALMIVILLVETLAFSCFGAEPVGKSGPAASTVTVYPAPEGAPVSTNYVLPVDGQAVPVYGVPTRNACFASCDIAGPVTVTATVNLLPPQKISVVSAHPLSLGIEVRRDASVCTFSVERPGSVTLLINGEYGGCPLYIFFNPPAEAPPKDAIVFGPGKHVLGYDNPITLTNGQSVYLAGGAWVEGIIRIYVNGKLEGEDTFTANKAGRSFGTTPWRLGIAQPESPKYRWPAHGILGGAQIYKVALTENEVQSLAEAEGR